MIVKSETIPFQDLDDKVSRRVLHVGDELMMVEFRFKQGGVGAVHSHTDHEQVGYIVRGRFEVTVGEEIKIIGPGDSYFAAKNVPHGVVALEDGAIVDSFTPLRRDFLSEDA